MNTPELLEHAQLSLLRAKIELQCVDDRSICIDVPARAHVRRSTLRAIQRTLDLLEKSAKAVPVVLALAFGAGQAKAADQSAAIAKAEQAVVLATCKLNFLQQRPGAKKNDKEYFGFMFQCMSK